MYGKITEIQRTSRTANPVTLIQYTYDAAGNRINKKVEKNDTNVKEHTWYVRDASGNVMATYNSTGSNSNLSSYTLNLTEQHMYGSARLGIVNRNVSVKAAFTNPSIVNFTRGNKFFELSNHLGNVLVTVSDKKIPISANGTTVDYYTADVVTANDYHPFGMQMPGRKYSQANSSYRYGFNRMEKNDEVKGSGNSYEFTFRIYDPRVGRFLSVDPIGKNYPHSSPYAFAENDVISSIDLEGLEKYRVTARSFIPMATLTNPWYTPNFSASSFAGDNRLSYQLNTTAFRTEQKVNVDFDNKSISYSNNTASGTKALDKKGKVIETSDPAAAGPVPTYDKSFLQNGNAATIHLSIDAPNKLVAGAPAINYQFDITIKPSADKKTFDYQIKGAADGFPAYELWITDETNNKSYLLFNRTPTETGETPRALFPPMEHKYNLKGNSGAKTPATEIKFSDIKNSCEDGEECK